MRVAVIDIGSNTIKLLVAGRSVPDRIETIRYAVEEARIGRGLGSVRPVLTPEAVARGVLAVKNLLSLAHAHAPERIALVATSAVRDATNGADLAARVLDETGHAVRILTGEEEANYIGRGLATDPALAGARDFYLFDLGGGSLECLEFNNRRRAQAVSLPLGCVRLTERCVRDSAAPFTAEDRASVASIVRQEFGSAATAAFRFPLPRPAAAVATGGTVTITRAMLAAPGDGNGAECGASVDVAELEALLTRVGSLPLPARRELPGLPAARADVFPAALATILEVARLAGAERFTHSFHNLRYGIADELLGDPACGR